MSRQVLLPKYVGETRAVVWDFTSQLSAGETISTAPTTASVYSGTDATPSGIISGSPTINGALVSQLITAGLQGNIYELLCTATTSASQVLQLSGFLAVLPELT